MNRIKTMTSQYRSCFPWMICFLGVFSVICLSIWNSNLQHLDKFVKLKVRNAFPRSDSFWYEKNDDVIRSKGVVAIGVLSRDQNVCAREALRKTMKARSKYYKHLDIKIFFLLDLHTPENDKEQQMYGDIFFLNTTENGWNQHFARKLYLWMSFVVRNFKNVLMIGKMDDDTFACTPQVFDRLLEVRHPLLYYGYPTGAGREAVDEFFIFIGIELARRVTNRTVCSKPQQKYCMPDGDGTHTFLTWIEQYKDMKFVDEKENNRMIWYYKGTGKGVQNLIKLFRTKSFCANYLVYHSATVQDMYSMTKWNSQLLGEPDQNFTSDYEKCMKRPLP